MNSMISRAWQRSGAATGQVAEVEEGDFVYIPPSTPVCVTNDGAAWLEYLVISAIIQAGPLS